MGSEGYAVDMEMGLDAEITTEMLLGLSQREALLLLNQQTINIRGDIHEARRDIANLRNTINGKIAGKADREDCKDKHERLEKLAPQYVTTRDAKIGVAILGVVITLSTIFSVVGAGIVKAGG